MPVSGLVITLREGAPLREQTVATVATHRSFTLGVLCDRWLPVAMEARDDRECRDLHDWLMSLPGVLFVDVVAVDFAPDDSTPSTGSTDPLAAYPIAPCRSAGRTECASKETISPAQPNSTDRP
jgi:hypothetical protein